MAKVAIVGNQGFSLLNFRGSLIADLCGRGHEVVAFAPEMAEDIRAQLQALGAQTIELNLARTGTNPIADLRAIFQLRRLLVDAAPDVMLAYAAKPVIYGTIAAWIAGVPRRFAMVEGLGFVFIERPGVRKSRTLLRLLVKKLYGFALRRAEKALFLNDDDISDFVSMGLLPPQKALCIGAIGVDLDSWAPEPAITTPITFTLVARLLRDKGVLEFVEAARRIKQRNLGVRFLLVGGLDENPESISAEEVVAWVDEGLIEWPGHTAVAPFLRQTSVFVLPSYREGVPRSTQEAMAMAKAIITTDVPGCRETVIDGVNGFLVPARNASALASAMQRFIDNPDLIVDMGRESRRLAEERFDVREANQRVMKVLGLL
jgi:glycosyltransferase involved in cell wall biosynthesis